MEKLKLLHTSDWHLGRVLCGRKRNDEFEAFLDWLSGAILSERIDVLLIAGDVFDNSAPSNGAQELYYSFLCRVAASACRHVVAVGGNHDSPSFLNAPRELLRSLNVHVVGSASVSPEDDVIVLRNAHNVAELIVCAVPYLRDRDIRTAEAGESIEDKDRKLVEGIRLRYAEACAAAEKIRSDLNKEIPIVATGHLFAAGGKTLDGDGVRELYVGSLAHVPAQVFPDCIDYLALGHLHSPQLVAGAETMRYSGSPLPMGFGEAGSAKSVSIVDFFGKSPSVREFAVPRFRKLERISGSWNEISARLDELAEAGGGAWVEIVCSGDEPASLIKERIQEKLIDGNVEVLRIRDARASECALSAREEETLEDLDEFEVFDRLLDAREVPEDQRPLLSLAYREIVALMREQDPMAE